MPDPKLIEAAAEIREILRKHDLAAIVGLCGQKPFTEFLYELCPSWSLIRVNAENTLRLRFKQSEYNSPEEAKAALTLTVSMLAGLLTLSRNQASNLESLLRRVSAAGNVITHTDRAEPPVTYGISADGKSITCRRCGRTSHHPEDVKQKYCGFCHVFHEDPQRPART